jgi:ComEC/Rec2-related protein
MIITRQPLVGVCLSAIVGISFSSKFSSWSWIIGGLGLLVLWCALKGTAWILLVTVCTFGCLHRLQTTESQATLLSYSLPPHLWQTQGIVTKVFRPFKKTTCLIVQTEKLRSGATEYHVSLKILLPWHGPAPEVGTTVKWIGWMRPIEKLRPQRFPHAPSFNRRAWLSSLDIDLESYKVTATRSIASPAKWHVRHWVEAARRRIAEAISRGIEKHDAEITLIRALTLGASHETEKMLAEAFRRTGTYHIFSVSGLHVGMVAAIVWQAFRILGIPHSITVPMTILTLFSYAGITGFRPPALRAACMASVFLVGSCVWRRALVLNSLAAAALCMLICKAELLFRPGFQLSFVVVTAIALLAPPLYRLGRKLCLPDPFLPRVLLTPMQRFFEQLGLAVVMVVAVSTAAWAGSTPLLLWHFQNASLSALFVNPLIVPLAFLILSFAALGTICDLLFSTWLATIFAHTNLAIASIVLAIVHWAASLSWGFLQIP